MCHVNVWTIGCHLGLLLVRKGEIAKLCVTLPAIDSIHFQVDDLVLPHNCCYPLTAMLSIEKAVKFLVLHGIYHVTIWEDGKLLVIRFGRYQKNNRTMCFFVNVQFWSSIKTFFEHDFLDFLTKPDPASGSTKMAKSCHIFLASKNGTKTMMTLESGGFLRIMINS